MRIRIKAKDPESRERSRDWERLRMMMQESVFLHTKITQLAKNFANTDWPKWARDEVPSKYTESSLKDLSEHHGLKDEQIELLMRIFNETLRFDESLETEIMPNMDVAAPVDVNPVDDAIEKLRFPADFPLRLGKVSSDVLEECEKMGVRTLGDLSKISRTDGLLSQCSEPLRNFVNTLILKDEEGLGEYLPVQEGGGGLDFVAAAALEINSLETGEVKALSFLYGYRPEGQSKRKMQSSRVSSEFCKTLEQRLMERFQAYLDYFQDDKQRLERRGQQDDPEAVDRFFSKIGDEEKVYVAARIGELAIGVRQPSGAKGKKKRSTSFLEGLLGRRGA